MRPHTGAHMIYYMMRPHTGAHIILKTFVNDTYLMRPHTGAHIVQGYTFGTNLMRHRLYLYL